MKKKYKSNIILIFLLTIFTLYIFNSTIIVKGILDYTSLFFTKLFPASFIIYIMASLLINYNFLSKLGKISKKPITLYLLMMSMISGFPSGPKYIKDLLKKKYINEDEGNIYLTYTHFPNPIFILGPVSILLKSSHLALKLLISIIISNLLISLFFKGKKENIPPTNKELPFIEALNYAIYDAIKVQILIYGTSIFFYLVSLLITTKIPFSPHLYIIINGLFDLTKGVFSTSILKNRILKSIIILLFTTFGTISIHMQIKSILMDTNLKYKYYLFGRFISTILATIIFLILIII